MKVFGNSKETIVLSAITNLHYQLLSITLDWVETHSKLTDKTSINVKIKFYLICVNL